MKTPHITYDEALKVFREFPDQDDFVCQNVQHYLYGGEPMDNSIELAQYWSRCKRIVIAHERSFSSNNLDTDAFGNCYSDAEPGL